MSEPHLAHHALELPGIHAGNPLAFLAGLGVLIATRARSRWRLDHIPVTMELDTPMTVVEVARAVAGQAGAFPVDDRTRYNLAEGGRVKFAEVVQKHLDVTAEQIARDLGAPWRYVDAGNGRNLRLDPHGVNQPYAYRASDPALSPHPVNLGAQACALIALSEIGESLWAGEELMWPIWADWHAWPWVSRAITLAPGVWVRGGLYVGHSRRRRIGYYRDMSYAMIAEGGSYHRALAAAAQRAYECAQRKQREAEKQERRKAHRAIRRKKKNKTKCPNSKSPTTAR